MSLQWKKRCVKPINIFLNPYRIDNQLQHMVQASKWCSSNCSIMDFANSTLFEYVICSWSGLYWLKCRPTQGTNNTSKYANVLETGAREQNLCWFDGDLYIGTIGTTYISITRCWWKQRMKPLLHLPKYNLTITLAGHYGWFSGVPAFQAKAITSLTKVGGVSVS